MIRNIHQAALIFVFGTVTMATSCAIAIARTEHARLERLRTRLVRGAENCETRADRDDCLAYVRDYCEVYMDSGLTRSDCDGIEWRRRLAVELAVGESEGK